jgi:carbon monoxide dehydrogenase subunit G
MELKGTHQFNAPLDVVWDALLDPKVLAQALPGGDQLEQIGDNDYRASMQVRVGPVQGRFEGKVELWDLVPQQSYRMKVSGQGAPGFVNGEGNIRLEASGDGTQLSYDGDVQVGGRIASVGQRLLDSSAKSIIRQGLKALDEQLQLRMSPVLAMPPTAEVPLPSRAPSTDSPATPQTPTPVIRSVSPAPISTTKLAAEVAKDVAKDLASDYIPPEQQPRVFYFVLGALSMLLFVVLVRIVQRD